MYGNLLSLKNIGQILLMKCLMPRLIPTIEDIQVPHIMSLADVIQYYILKPE